MGDFGVNQATKTWVQGAVVCHYINQGEPRWTERVSLPALKKRCKYLFLFKYTTTRANLTIKNGLKVGYDTPLRNVIWLEKMARPETKQ